jgi:hypothetical protein
MTVYGNGQVVHDLMVGTALIMKSSGFLVLTLFLAMTAFFIMAVNAGFDPGKNLLKMFGYIFVVFGVSLGSNLDNRGIVMNVFINDKVNNNILLTYNPLVTDVPVLIAFPAVLTSEVGRFFTEQFETNFLNPSGYDPAIFGLTGGAAGQFNLFNRMMTDAQEFRITNPELQRSVSMYMADCVIPAMARGAMTMKELSESTNLNATLSKATHKSIMTKYYFSDVPAVQEVLTGATLSAETRTALTSAASGTMAGASGNGIVMPCEDAYNSMQVQMTNHAGFLLNAAGEAWRKSGVQVPFATAMDSMLQSAGASTGATPGSPANFIKQQAFLNQMDPAMRTAAAQTGNNVLLQSAAIAQAEQSQKSAWVSGFALFNNMMGYVFTVLQAFIFAVTPMIVVALLIPGFGSAIFKNYAQILLWLTLWEPMLALINYLITSFSISSTATSLVSTSGSGPLVEGFNKASNWVMSERTNTLTIAAQFLGTMVPMITWGIVKGAMAFTEFISHGIGSSFANTAGAAAASGSLSWNNSQMNNFSGNKFNGAMSSSVGNQETSAFYGAGTGIGTFQAGGANATANGTGINAAKEAAAQISQSRAEAAKISDAITNAFNKSSSLAAVKNELASNLSGSTLTKALNIVDQNTVGKSESAKKGDGSGSDANHADKAGNAVEAQKGTSADAKISAGTPQLWGASLSGSTGANARTGESAERTTEGGKSNKTNQSFGVDTVVNNGDSHSKSASTTKNSSNTRQAGTTLSKTESETFAQTKSRAINAAKEITASLTAAESITSKQSAATAMDMTRANAALQAIKELDSAMLDKAATLDQTGAALKKLDQAIGTPGFTPGLQSASTLNPDTRPAAAAAADADFQKLEAQRRAMVAANGAHAPTPGEMTVVSKNLQETAAGFSNDVKDRIESDRGAVASAIKGETNNANKQLEKGAIEALAGQGLEALNATPGAAAKGRRADE